MHKKIMISIPEETLLKLRAFLRWKYRGDWRGVQSREIARAIEEYIARRLPEDAFSSVLEQIEGDLGKESEDGEVRGYL